MTTMHGNAWIGENDGSLVKVEIRVERTDTDEVAVFSDSADVETSAVYLSRATAKDVAAALVEAAKGEAA